MYAIKLPIRQNRLLLCCCLGLLPWLAASSDSNAATYYVRTDGSDSNTGLGPSASEAFQTIDEIMDLKVTSPGDVVYVKSGTYVEQVKGKLDGTSVNPIVVIADTTGAVSGWSPGEVIIQAPTVQVALLVDKVDYIQFHGFNIQGNGVQDAVTWKDSVGGGIGSCQIYGGGDGVSVLHANSTLTLLNCLIRDNGGDGIHVDGGTVTVLNSTIVDNGGDGLDVGSNSGTVYNTILAGNGNYGFRRQGDGDGTLTHYFNQLFGNLSGNYSGTSGSAGEITTDPQFVSSTDFHLRSTSPGKDTGVSLAGSVDTDFHGNPRPYNANWDMGYHEYGATQGSKTLLLISENNGYLTTQERARKTLFEIWGYAVDALWDGESQTNYDAALATSSVVYVSEEASSTDVAYKLRESTLGVVIDEPALSDEMGISSLTSDPGTHTAITIDDNSHYITSPFATGSLTIYDSAQDVRAMSGTVASGASVLGSYSTNNGLAAVDIGANLFNTYNGSSIAFGRRVFLPVGSGFDFTSLTDDGRTLVRRALEWALGDLVGHWKLDETSGTLAADSSHHGNDGTYTNGAVLAQTGIYGTAVSFDGNDDRVVVPDDPALNVSANVTMAAWVHPAQTGNSERMIINKEGEYEMALTNTGELKWAYKNTDPGWSWHYTGTIVPDDEWSHIAVTYSEGTVKSYVNGVLVDTYNGSGNIGDQYPAYDELWIGGRSNNPTGASFGGLIDDARVYSKELTAAEVAALYDLQGHWRLDENSGTAAADSSPQAFDGTYVGSPTLAETGAYPGDVLTAVDFDGTNDQVDLPTMNIDFSTGMTLSVWVKPSAAPSPYAAMVSLSLGVLDNDIWFGWQPSYGLEIFLSDTVGGGATTWLADYIEMQIGVWEHCVVTIDAAGNAKLYRNGVETASGFTSLPANVSRSLNYIAHSAFNDSFPGTIDDVRIYNRPLSAIEITELYGLVGHWNMDEGSGSTAADGTPFGNDATINGATWVTDCAGRYGLAFDGVSQTATTTVDFDPPATGAVTAWLRSAGNPGARSRPFGIGNNWEMRQEPDGTLSFDLGGEGPPEFATSDGLSFEDRWYHVIAQFDASDDSYEVYIDGVLVEDGTNSSDMVKQIAGTLTFGTRTGSSQFWEGGMRDFRVYNRCLSDAEISKLSGLIALWKLDEVSGTVAADSSLNGHDGTLTGSPTWTTAGIIDGALDFETSDGDDSVAVGSFGVNGNELSLAAWVKPEDGGTDRRIIIKGSSLSLADQYWGMAVGSSLELDFRLKAGGTTDLFTEVNVLSTGKWHHVAGTYDGTTMRMYVNGVEVGSAVHSVGGGLDVGSSVPVTIGAANVSGRPFDGLLDDVRVLNRVMCSEEIRELYKGGRPAGIRILKWVETR